MLSLILYVDKLQLTYYRIKSVKRLGRNFVFIAAVRGFNQEKKNERKI